jgi:predicted RNase H-like nuclease (RuvC/YqgF family)
MPYSNDINLDRDLTEDDIKKLEEEAERIEKAAKKAEKEVEEIKKDAATLVEFEEKITEKAKKIRETIGRTIKRENELTSSTSPLSAIGGDVTFEEREEMLLGVGRDPRDPTDVALPLRGRDTTSRAPAAYLELQKRIREQEIQIKKNTEEIEKTRKTIMDLERQLEGKTREILQITASPMYIESKILGILRASPFIAAAFFARDIIEEIVKRVKSLFEAGGIFDLRKMVLDAAREINSLDHIVRINTGQVFFTSDSSEVLRQGVQYNESSNTRRLQYGHKLALQVSQNG